MGHGRWISSRSPSGAAAQANIVCNLETAPSGPLPSGLQNALSSGVSREFLARLHSLLSWQTPFSPLKQSVSVLKGMRRKKKVCSKMGTFCSHYSFSCGGRCARCLSCGPQPVLGLLGSFTFLALFCFPRAGAEERLPYFPGVQLLQHFKALSPGVGVGGRAWKNFDQESWGWLQGHKLEAQFLKK